MEEILEKFGNPGKYHILIAIMLSITWWSVCLGTVAMSFYGTTPNYTCDIEFSIKLNNETFSSDVSLLNITESEDHCSYALDGHDRKLCHKWIYYDEGAGKETVSTEWDLVCGDTYRVSLASTLFFCGVFVGALVFGFVADHLGRKKTLAICLYTQMPISLAIAFMPSYVPFTIMRFVLGIWLQGVSSVAFLHCIEFFRQKYRGVVMVGFGISWAFAQLLATGIAYFVTDWRHMQIIASGLALVTVPYFWWLPESPRWLQVKGRHTEITSDFIPKASRMNGLNVTEMVDWCAIRLQELRQSQTGAGSSESDQSFVRMLKTPVLLLRLAGMCFMWYVASMTYYIFIFNTANLAGDQYLNFAIGAGLEILVNLFMLYILARWNRKYPLLAACCLIGIVCVISGAVPKTINISWIVTAFALCGKMVSAAFLCLIFVYAAELFPTFARGSCLALCGCSMRVGGIVAPQVLYLAVKTFDQFPYVVVAVKIFICIVITLLLPDTFKKSMPNTIEEAVNMAPEPTSDRVRGGNSLLYRCGNSPASETSSNSTEPEKHKLVEA
ncbi:organic cation transporter protein-like isoform X2 [Watersipora subatra]|uniref:organic cation transporter protein-like isoform X2 n=1 Tax=Watersipora subatra TaxID=2589382 RepID=UPI00355AD964